MNEETNIGEVIKDKDVHKATVLMLLPTVIAFSIPFLIFLFLTIISLVSFIKSTTYVETTATIVDIKQKGDGFVGIYEFDYNGSKVRVEGLTETNKDHYDIGSTITIRYNPKDYKEYSIGKGADTMMLFISLMFFIPTALLLKKIVGIIKLYIQRYKGVVN